MEKKIITEEILNDWLNKFLILEDDDDDDEDESKYVKKTQSLKNASKDVGDYIQKLINSGNENVFLYAKQLGINLNFDPSDASTFKSSLRNRDNGNLNDTIVKYVKNAIFKLKECGITKTGGVRFDILKAKYPNEYDELIKAKEFIDLMGLGFLYDKNQNPSEIFGIKKTKNGNYSYEGLNFNKISDSQIKDYRKNRKNDVLDDYDVVYKIKNSVVQRYLNEVYGVKMEVPNFTLGNKKVKGALIVNFTSAMKCPAWNECLVKHACYARASEVRHWDKQKILNDKKNFLWVTALDVGEELKTLMRNLLFATVIDYGKASKILGVDSEVLRKQKLSALDETTLSTLKGCLYVKNLRINENGDFINQDLLDWFDSDIAYEFNFVGVVSAAYICRNLNYENVKNIILNASRITMNGNMIKRYFYALSEDLYDAFTDTYESFNIKDKINSVKQKPLPLGFIKNGVFQPNGNYYYKCPCSRKDFNINEEDNKNEVTCYQCHLCYEDNSEELKTMLNNSENSKFYVFVKAHGSNRGKLDDNKVKNNELINKIGFCEGFDLNQINTKIIKESNLNPILQSSEEEAYGEITENAIYSMKRHFSDLSNKLNENKNKFYNVFDKIAKI